MKITIDNEMEMQQFAARVARATQIGDWIGLTGGLGVGKTVFARAFIAALGFEGEVSSPSYALVHSYDPPLTHFHISHADLYRIETDQDYQELGLDEALNYGVVLSEWAEKYPLKLPDNRFEIKIQKSSEIKREITLNISGDGLSRWT